MHEIKAEITGLRGTLERPAKFEKLLNKSDVISIYFIFSINFSKHNRIINFKLKFHQKPSKLSQSFQGFWYSPIARERFREKLQIFRENTLK